MEAALRARSVPFDVHLTSGRGSAGEIATAVAAAPATRIVLAVGGDGTLHEVMNGMLAGLESLPDDAPALALVPAGRGSDYARGLRLPIDPDVVAARLAAALEDPAGAARRVDVGEVVYQPETVVAGRPAATRPTDDEPQRRRFINGAGIGFSPFVAQRTARFPPRLGAYLYTAAGFLTLIDWHERLVEIAWADGALEERAIESLEFALAGFEGGGMQVAPGADPTDGLFDAVVFGALSRAELFTFSWRIRTGDHTRSPRVEIRRTTGAMVRVIDERGPLHLQADGELLGRDPFVFRLLPSAVRFVW